MKQYEELIAHAKREVGGIDPKFEILKTTEPYPDVFLIVFRYTSKGVPGSIETMVTTRFAIETPEGRTGGIITSEFKETK